MANFIKKTWDEVPPIAKTVIVLGGGFLLYRAIKKYTDKPAPKQLPEGGQGLPVVGHDPSGNAVYWNPDSMAQQLFNVMDGLFTGSATKDEAFTKFGQLPSNDMIVSTYNTFNNKYGKGETLTKWINDEWFTDITGSGKDLALSRLDQLNLK
ncbi:MAG: hypothetical protein WCH21_02215 [Bacteroidota bacterium]